LAVIDIKFNLANDGQSIIAEMVILFTMRRESRTFYQDIS